MLRAFIFGVGSGEGKLECDLEKLSEEDRNLLQGRLFSLGVGFPELRRKVTINGSVFASPSRHHLIVAADRNLEDVLKACREDEEQIQLHLALAYLKEKTRHQ